MFTLGSDPEVLLVNPQGKLISSVGLIGGSKLDPKRTKHGHVQEDNVLVEFNTEPANSKDQFITNTLNMIQDIEDIITPLDLSVRIESSGLFDRDQLESLQAVIAGCEADYNAWTLRENPAPELADTQLRTCGGHLHIAFDRANETDYSRTDLVKVMDLVAGVPSVLMDEDTDRRTLYGKAGASRPKYKEGGDPYDGVEYRTLSNFWLRSQAHIGWAYSAVERAVGDFDNLLRLANSERDTIIKAINGSNRQAANDLVHEYNLGVV